MSRCSSTPIVHIKGSDPEKKMKQLLSGRNNQKTMLYLWQFPHFYAIAWLYREDYRAAGIRMLPVVEPAGDGTGRQIIAYAFNLIPVSVAPWLLGLAGPVYCAAAVVLGCGYLYYGVRLAREKTKPAARRLLLASVVYLPLLYLFLVADKA